jgi:hypothetical protein
LASRSAPLMRALGTNKLRQSMMGTGQIRDALTTKQAWPGAPADLQQVCHRGGEGPGLGLRLPHGPAQPWPPPPHRCLRALRVRMQEVRRAMDPVRGSTHRGPQRRGRVQPVPQDRLQAPAGLGPGPLCSTRSRLGARAVRRSWRGRPAAAQGGRPSSGRALRTALQSPRMPSASGAVRPATARARGRPPRPCFVRPLLAWRSAAEIGVAAARRSGK